MEDCGKCGEKITGDCLLSGNVHYHHHCMKVTFDGYDGDDNDDDVTDGDDDDDDVTDDDDNDDVGWTMFLSNTHNCQQKYFIV